MFRRSTAMTEDVSCDEGGVGRMEPWHDALAWNRTSRWIISSGATSLAMYILPRAASPYVCGPTVWANLLHSTLLL